MNFFLVCLILLLISLICVTNGAELYEMKRIQLTNGMVFNLYVDYCNLVAINETDTANVTLANLTIRCYCYYDESDSSNYVCSSPGPTLVFYNGTNFTVNLVNRMDGSNAGESSNEFYHDPDVTNLHTHGLHVDPVVDDVIDIVINPGKNHSYNYAILPSHYPGTHWYHAHWHGSVAFQVQSGLVGALLMERENNEDIDPDLADMTEKVIIFHGMYLRNNEGCADVCEDITNNEVIYDLRCKAAFSIGAFVFQGLCDIWCCMSRAQRDASKGPYDNIGADNVTLHLVNGLVEPTLTINSSEYIRLRLINAQSQLDYNLKFPSECEKYLIALDGIFFENGMRNLSASPYQDYLFIPTAGRADVIIKCPSGNYVIKHEMRSNFDLASYPMQNETITLIDLNVLSTTHSNSLPENFPAYPDYLAYTLNMTNYNSDCSCAHDNSFGCNISVSPFPDKNPQGIFGINNLPFNHTTPLMYINNKKKLFQFTISFFVHPFHHHINPFQILETDTYDGYFSRAGDWRDTLTAYNDVRVNTWLLDYTGKITVHCHFLPHEDHGLMGYYIITDSSACPFDNDDANNSIQLLSWYTIVIHFSIIIMYLQF